MAKKEPVMRLLFRVGGRTAGELARVADRTDAEILAFVHKHYTAATSTPSSTENP